MDICLIFDDFRIAFKSFEIETKRKYRTYRKKLYYKFLFFKVDGQIHIGIVKTK